MPSIEALEHAQESLDAGRPLAALELPQGILFRRFKRGDPFLES